MDKAYDMSRSGDPIIVIAESIKENSIKAKTQRFSCPVCGEYVTFIASSKKKNHFSHLKSYSYTLPCDNRVQTNQSPYSYYEVKGLPIYLLKSNHSGFKLYICFNSLGSSYFRVLLKQNISVTIIGNREKTISIDDINFYEDESTLIDVKFLPKNERYELTFNTSNNNLINILKSKWSDFCDFDYKSGVIFTSTETGGRKLSRGSVIYSNTEYLLLTLNNPPNYKGLQCELLDVMKVDSKDLKIFRIKYNETKDSLMDFSQSFCSDRLRLIYRTKKPEITPLWPPFYTVNNESTVINKGKLAIYSIKNLNNRKLIASTGELDEEIDLNRIQDGVETFSVDISTNNKYISIDSNYGEHEIIINNRSKNLNQYLINYKILSDQTTGYNDLYINKKYNFVFDQGTNLIYTNNQHRVFKQLLSSTSDTKQFTINEPGVLISRIRNFTLEKRFIVDNVKQNDYSAINDLTLFYMLKNSMKSKIVYFGKADYYISKFKHLPLSYKFLSNIKSHNYIPKNIRDIILKYGG